jgi:hypothetical protein
VIWIVGAALWSDDAFVQQRIGEYEEEADTGDVVVEPCYDPA